MRDARRQRSLLLAWVAAGVTVAGSAHAQSTPDSSAPAAQAPATEPAAEATQAPAAPAPPTHPLRGLKLHADSPGWDLSFYGFAELDGIYDSTQSFGEGILNNTLQRPHTVAGDNPRAQGTVRNSRIGFDLRAPDFGSIKTSGVIEMDFFGNQNGSTENDVFTSPLLRLRHFYVKMETPIVDVLVGQYHDLFGWGGAGFYPNTDAFLPLLGEIYHRDAQLRVSKTIGGDAVSLEVAVAAVRPEQRDSAAPDGQAGLRLAFNGIRGASTPGASQPTSAPLELGVSGLVRRLSVADFSSTPGSPHTVTAGGGALSLFAPIIPVHGSDDLRNGLSITAEGSIGTGIADMYPGLTGGVQFPQLPNPQNAQPVPQYTPDIDPGIVTYDAFDVLHTINWSMFLVNAQYHLPIGNGKVVWVSGTYSAIKSNNDVSLTPAQGQPFVWNSGYYFDGNLWLGITPQVQVALSFQQITETFGDGVQNHNNRGEGSCFFFF